MARWTQRLHLVATPSSYASRQRRTDVRVTYHRHSRRSPLSSWSQFRWAWFALLVPVAMLAGVAAIVGTAALSSSPVLFLTVGWFVFALCVVFAARAGLRRTHRRRIAGLTLVALAVLGGAALLVPGSASRPGAPAGTRWVTLPTGSRLAYLRLPGAAPHQPTPVIFLHGGPGVADMRGDAGYLRTLSEAGFTVYLYDQLGAGHSARLQNPTGYTMSRAVADLDAFRRAMGLDRVDLLGYSWGSTLAAAYLAARPNHVANVVFASPGPMVGGASDVNDLLGRLDAAQRWAVLSQVLQPRAFLAWTLTQINPDAAHAYAGDAEMDTRFRSIVAATAPRSTALPPDRPKAVTPASMQATRCSALPPGSIPIEPCGTCEHLR